ncbi:hypothetical protein M2D63_023790, partial [Pseudomonas sp. BJa5]
GLAPRSRCGREATIAGQARSYKMIDIQDINQAFVRMEKNDVKYRFVIDMASLKP